MNISASAAALYTQKQREELCGWCKEQGAITACSKCGITQTEPRKEKKVDSGKQK